MDCSGYSHFLMQMVMMGQYSKEAVKFKNALAFLPRDCTHDESQRHFVRVSKVTSIAQ